MNNLMNFDDEDLIEMETNISWKNESLRMLDVLAPWTIALLPLSILQLLSGLVIFFAIVSAASLRTSQNFVILAHVAGSDAIFAVGCVVTASIRLYHYQYGISAETTVRNCIYLDLYRFTFYINSNGFLLLLAINRLMAVAAPMWFQTFAARRVFRILMAVIYGRTMFHVALIIVAANDDPVPLCGYLPVHGWENKVISILAILCAVSTAGVYVAAALTTYVRLVLVKRRHGNVTETRQQLQVHVMWTMALILLIHLSTTTLGNFTAIYTESYHLGMERNYIAFVCAGYFISLNTVLYLLVLYWRCEDFRQGVFQMLRMSKNNATVGVAVYRRPSQPSQPWLDLERRMSHQVGELCAGTKKAFQVVRIA